MHLRVQPRPLRIADLFAGAGGTSTGALEAARALGYAPKLTAVNHWPVAVETHTLNHPDERHLCTGVDTVDPRSLFAEGELDLLWASPECQHHSNARGGRPVSDQSRSTAWCVPRWTEALRPTTILVENVKEFANWGPLDRKGRPLKSRCGDIFRAWMGAIEALGYKISQRVLCAADYGEAQSRERLFIQAVRRGSRRIVWPDPTHTRSSEPDLFARMPRWRSARDHVIDWSLQGQWLDEMKPKERYGGLPLSPNTLRRIHRGFFRYGPRAYLAPNFGERAGQQPRTHCLDEPLPAVTGHGAGALIEPFILAPEGIHRGNAPRSVDQPLQTVTAARGGGRLIEPFLVELRGTTPGHLDRTARSLDEPIGAIAAQGGHFALAEPFLMHTNHSGGDRTRSLDEPVPTICGTRGELAMIQPAILPQQSDGRLRPVSEPISTVAAAGAISLLEPFLIEYYGTGGAASVDEPLSTVTTRDRYALVCPQVMIAGRRYRVRFRYRMLQPHELARAQGFPDDYQFCGNKTERTRQIGNAVSRRTARALVAAALSQNSDVSWLEN